MAIHHHNQFHPTYAEARRLAGEERAAVLRAFWRDGAAYLRGLRTAPGAANGSQPGSPSAMRPGALAG